LGGLRGGVGGQAAATMATATNANTTAQNQNTAETKVTNAQLSTDSTAKRIQTTSLDRNTLALNNLFRQLVSLQATAGARAVSGAAPIVAPLPVAKPIGTAKQVQAQALPQGYAGRDVPILLGGPQGRGSVAPGAGGRNIGSGAGSMLGLTLVASALAMSFTEADSAMSSFVRNLTTGVAVLFGLQLVGGVVQTFVAKMIAATQALRTNQVAQGSRLAFARGVVIGGGGAGRFGGQSGRIAHLNSLSTAMTGLRTSTLLAAGAMAGIVVAIHAWAASLRRESVKQAREARTPQEFEEAVRLGRLGREKGFAGTGAGIGALVGAGIGTLVAPGPGTVIGTVIGGSVGAIGGVGTGKGLSDAKIRAQAAADQRQGIFEEVSDDLTASLGRLTSGDVQIPGSAILGDVSKDLAALRKIETQALQAGDESEALAFRKSLRGFSTDVELIKNAILPTVSSLEEFRDETAIGAEVIKTLATVRNQTTFEVEQQMRREIEARNEIIKSMRTQREAQERTGSLVVLLTKFQAALGDTVSRLEHFATQMDVISSVAGGAVGLGGFTGQPGFGQSSRITQTGVLDLPQFQAALKQTFQGLGSELGDQGFKRVSDIAVLLNELPRVLTEVGASGAIDPEGEGGRIAFDAAFASRFQGRGIGRETAQTMSNIIGNGIDRYLTSEGQGQVGKFTDLARTNPQKLLRDLGGQEYDEVFKRIDDVAKGTLAAVKILDNAIKAQVNLEVNIARKRVELAQHTLQAEQTIFDATNQNPALQFGVGRVTAAKGRQVQGLAPGIDPFDINALGAQLSSVNRQIIAENARRQAVSPLGEPEEFKKITNNIAALNTESQKLRAAFQILADVTDETAQIQKTLNALEEQRKARFGLAERFTFGTREDRQKILRSIIDTIRVTSGGESISRIPESRRAGIQSFLRQFENVPTLAAGIGPEGRAQTGLQGLVGVTQRRLGGIGIPPQWQALFGMENLDLDKLGANPLELSRGEAGLVQQLEALFKRRNEAELQLIKDMDAGLKTLITQMGDEFDNFTTTLVQELRNIEIEQQQRQIALATADKTTKKKQQIAIKDIQEFAQFAGLGQVSPKGAFKIAQQVGGQPELIGRYLSGLAAEDAARLLGKRQGRDISAFAVTGTAGTGAQRTGFTSINSPREIRAALESAVVAGSQSATGGTTGIIQAIEKANIPLFKSFTEQGLLTDRQLNELYQTIADASLRFAETRDPVTGGSTRAGLGINFSNIFSSEISPAIGDALASAALDIEAKLQKTAGIPRAEDPQDELNVAFSRLLLDASEDIAVLWGAINTLDESSVGAVSGEIIKLSNALKVLERQLSAMTGEETADQNASKAADFFLNRGQPVGGDADTFSKGGNVFRRRGTDTVPAMLTPGEFVVNRGATAKNRGLLSSINSGTVYAANGGLIDPRREKMEQLLRELTEQQNKPGAVNSDLFALKQSRIKRLQKSLGYADDSFGRFANFGEGFGPSAAPRQVPSGGFDDVLQRFVNPQEASLRDRGFETHGESLVNRGFEFEDNASLRSRGFEFAEPRNPVIGKQSAQQSGQASSDARAIIQGMGDLPAQLDKSATLMNEAASKHEASTVTMKESAEELPEAVATAINEGGETIKQAIGDSTTELSASFDTFGQSVTQLATVVTEMATTAESMKSAAQEIATALAQEVQINVTHTHEPITVTVEGGETTTQDGDAFSDMVMEVVGPEIDEVVNRIRNVGFGMA
jgi:hypothetical protein